MRVTLIAMGFLALLFGCKPKTGVSDKLAFDLKSVLDTVDLEEVSIGEIHLPTGKIIAGDPFFIYDNKPFKTKVNPGNYPVKLLIYKVEEDHYRIAFAKIQFSGNQAIHWTLALTEDITDEQIKSLQPGEFFGYGVDAGLGCFIDQETNTIFNSVMDKFSKDNPDKNYYDDVLAEEFRTTSGQHPLSRDLGDWDNHFPKQGDNHNVIMFASGWGDGSYPTYWGTDLNGKIVELITDFIVVGGE
ncbi:DUF4241 domain-containing protein [Ohtaekwangia kribbensis]|jgi:hypothetical protein|uniref:DUF4241 domain-containing protein n=1 Tax=Ohtaekwangia kribbensis TaxID=688913 RepID=A0ABW3K4X0_9BACT